jgi:hypothetical protein
MGWKSGIRGNRIDRKKSGPSLHPLFEKRKEMDVGHSDILPPENHIFGSPEIKKITAFFGPEIQELSFVPRPTADVSRTFGYWTKETKKPLRQPHQDAQTPTSAIESYALRTKRSQAFLQFFFDTIQSFFPRNLHQNPIPPEFWGKNPTPRFKPLRESARPPTDEPLCNRVSRIPLNLLDGPISEANQ